MESTRQEPVSRYVQQLTIERAEHGSTVVFCCRGPFSILNDLRLREFAKEVAEVEGQRVVLDFREVTYLDSRGLGTLASCIKGTQALQKELLLVTNPHVRTVIVTTGLDRVLQLRESLDEALR